MGKVDATVWTANRIVYGDVEEGAIMVVDADGGTADVLLEATNAACPAISDDGETIAASLRGEGQIVLVRRIGFVETFEGLGGGDPFRVTLNPDADKPSDMDLAIELIPIELRKPNADLIIQFKNTKITRVTGLAF